MTYGLIQSSLEPFQVLSPAEGENDWPMICKMPTMRAIEMGMKSWQQVFPFLFNCSEKFFRA